MTTKAKVRLDDEYAYTNKFSKKRIHFSPKLDEVVATFQPRTTEKAAVDIMEATSLAVSQGIDLERGFAVFYVPPQRKFSAAIDSLTDQPQITNAIPVMVDDEGLTRYFLPDELTVQFKEGLSKELAEKIIKQNGSWIVTVQRTPGYYTIAVPEGKGLFETIRRFSELEEVAFAEPSEAGFNDALAYIPSFPDFQNLWGLHNTGQTVNSAAGLANSDINATEAWDISRGDPNIIISVIDTGAHLNHPDLAANILLRGGEDWDFADTGDSSPDDMDGHGTHVAGTAAGIDNPVGVIGVAPRCSIMPLRINLMLGINQNRADAINYVAAQATANPNKRYVVNCSWKTNGDHAGIHSAIINAVNNNVVVVFAAGNANKDIGMDPFYPAIYPEVISVVATDSHDRKASFSNYGINASVSAPGVNIYSTYLNSKYTFLNGTSMASPHVAGLAALILSRNPSLTCQQVRSIIETSSDNIDAKNPGFEGKLGKGRINAFKALSATPLPPIGFELLRKFPFPQENNGSSTALSFAPRIRLGFRLVPALIFLTQQPFSEHIYYLNPITGAVISSVDPVNNDTIGSLEWDGVNVLVANVTVGSGSINTINPRTGAQLGSIPAPEGRGEGLAYDGKVLYYSTIARIHVIDPSTGAVLHSFPAPDGECRSLAYGKGYLFSGNSSTGIITVLDVSTLAIRGTIAAPGGASGKIEGLAFNPSTDELFIANQGDNTIYAGKITL